MTESLPDLPKLLRLQLRTARITQTNAAEALGISQPALADKLAGRRPLMVGEALALANLLGTDVADATETTHRIDMVQDELVALAELATQQIYDVICALETPDLVSA